MNEAYEAICRRLRQFSDAYAKKDLTGALDAFSKTQDEIVVIGSADREMVTGLEAIKREFIIAFEDPAITDFQTHGVTCNVFAGAAYVALTCQASKRYGSKVICLSGRLTVVMVQEAEGWFIAHLHFSYPYSPAEVPTEISEVFKMRTAVA